MRTSSGRSKTILKPNIFLLTIDCLRYDAVTEELMPNLYTFGKENVWYTNAYTEAHHTAIVFQQLFESEFHLKLKELGYYNIGINYNAWLSKHYGYNHGFDFWWDIFNLEGKVEIDDSEELNKILFTKLENHTPLPFFAWVHYMDCHIPYYPYKWDNYMLAASVGTPIVPLDENTANILRNRYNESLKHMDDQLGIFFDFLTKKGLYEEALIIISADHGEEFFEYGRFGHVQQTEPNEYLLHIPLFVKRPHNLSNNIEDKVLFKQIEWIVLRHAS